MKLPKFAIAKNPMTMNRDDYREYIVHMREPIIIATAFHFSRDNENEMIELKKTFEVSSNTYLGNEHILIAAVEIAPNDLSADKLDELMCRMADWYKAYSISEYKKGK